MPCECEQRGRRPRNRATRREAACQRATRRCTPCACRHTHGVARLDWHAGRLLRVRKLTSTDPWVSPGWMSPGRALNKEQACAHGQDRKSTRLNSSHLVISYAVFCLKKKKK